MIASWKSPGRRCSLAVAHEEHEPAVGHGSEQPLDECRADEPCRAGDRDAAS